MDDPRAQADLLRNTMASPLMSPYHTLMGGPNNAIGQAGRMMGTGMLPPMPVKSTIGHVSGRSVDRRLPQDYHPRFELLPGPPPQVNNNFNIMPSMWVPPGGRMMPVTCDWQPDGGLFPSTSSIRRKRRPTEPDDVNPPVKIRAGVVKESVPCEQTPVSSFNCVDSTFDGGFALFGDSAADAVPNSFETPRWDLSNVLHFGEDLQLGLSGPASPTTTFAKPRPRSPVKQPRPNPFDAVGLLADSLLSSSVNDFSPATNFSMPVQNDASQILNDLTRRPPESRSGEAGSEAVHDPLRKLKTVPFAIAPPTSEELRRRPLKSPLISSKSDDGSLDSSISTTPSATDAPAAKRQTRQRSPSHRNLSNSRYLKKRDSCGNTADESGYASRPELNDQSLAELNDISCFRNDEKHAKAIVDYHEGISFPLGEGGRELLRACLNVKGCKGRQLQGASVPSLLSLAHQWRLWDVAIRIKVERATGQLCPQHEAFVRFKATQSQMRKYVKKEYMVTERDNSGKISKIVYDETRKITLGKEGREALRAQLRRLHDKHAHKMDELLERHSFKYSELRNATVQQLSRMAFVCNLWDQVVHACRKQEEKKDGKVQRDHVMGNPQFGGHEPQPGHMLPQDTTVCKAEPQEMPNGGHQEEPADHCNNLYPPDEESLFSTGPQMGMECLLPSEPPPLVKRELDCSKDSADKNDDPYVHMPSQQSENGGPEVSIEDFIKYAPAFLPSSAQEAIAELFRGNVGGDKLSQDEDSVFQAIMDMVPFTSGAAVSGVKGSASSSSGRSDEEAQDILNAPMFPMASTNKLPSSSEHGNWV